jgi:hypothetical protein
MDSTETAPLPAPPPVDVRAPAPARRPRWLPAPGLLESLAVFAVFAAVYFIVGYRVVVDQHLVNFDALSRLSHAYFVWHNDPPKLASVGFVWPPVQTLIYLPFALIKPLATSLAALPAASATFMAAMMVALNRVLGIAEIRWFGRYPLLLVFGLNPMILYYGANGMAEAVYLFFLVAGIYFLIRWDLARQGYILAFVGVALALALLSRYEILPFALVIAAAIVVITVYGRARGSAQELEAALVLYLAPIAYAGAAWLFFNWLILGDPFNFLNLGATTADIGASQQDVGDLPAQNLGVAGVAVYMAKLNFALFPLAVLVLPALLITALVRRNPMSAVLAALLATNAIVTAILFLRTGDSNLLQLRYNMRAIPIALIGAAWLYYVWRPRPARVAIWVATMAVLVGSLAMTWRTMEIYTYQYEENVFLRALETGEDQEGNTGIAGYPIGIADERQIADFISANVGENNVILTDDAQTLGVMLLTGRPDRFFDRIDHGDKKWMAALGDPYGKADYLLVSTDERCRAPCEDLVRVRYPGVLRDEIRGMRVVDSTGRYALVKVDLQAPSDGGASDAGGDGEAQ